MQVTHAPTNGRYSFHVCQSADVKTSVDTSLPIVLSRTPGLTPHQPVDFFVGPEFSLPEKFDTVILSDQNGNFEFNPPTADGINRFQALCESPNTSTTLHLLLQQKKMSAKSLARQINRTRDNVGDVKRGQKFVYDLVREIAKALEQDADQFCNQVMIDNLIVQFGQFPEELRNGIDGMLGAEENGRNLLADLVAEEIRELQTSSPKEWTLRKIGEKTGLTERQLELILRGDLFPSISHLQSLTILGLSFDTLLEHLIASRIAYEYWELGDKLPEGLAELQSMIPSERFTTASQGQG